MNGDFFLHLNVIYHSLSQPQCLPEESDDIILEFWSSEDTKKFRKLKFFLHWAGNCECLLQTEAMRGKMNEE